MSKRAEDFAELDIPRVRSRVWLPRIMSRHVA